MANNNTRFEQPLVSVCIPTYNGAHYILEALESVNTQTYSNIEIVISDDDSKDETLKIATEFKEKSKFPVKIINHEPCGIANNWNNSINNASGIYIKLLFQDDLLAPNCVESMVAIMESNPKVGLVSSKRNIIFNKESRFTQGWLSNFDDLQKNLELPNKDVVIRSGRDLLKAPYFKEKPINIIGEPSCYLFRKSLFEEIGAYKNDMFQLVDYEFCLRIFKRYNIAFIKEKLVSFRLHEDQASFVNHQSNINDKDIFYRILYKEYFWYLHTNFKWLLIKKFHWSVQFYRMLRYGKQIV